jgi:hypothetical protein
VVGAEPLEGGWEVVAGSRTNNYPGGGGRRAVDDMGWDVGWG